MRILGLIAAALAMTGQASNDGTASDAPTPGTITVELVGGEGISEAAAQPFAEAVGDALSDAHFLVMPGQGHSRYIAEVSVAREARGAVAAAAPSGGVSVAGASIGVSLPAKDTQISGLVVTRLDVRIVLRDGDRPVWGGSASTAQVDGTREGATPAVAEKLADALVRRFPALVEGAIAVP